MIRVENLTRTYGETLAVDDVSFSIAPGEIVGLLGHNGAGKTTIMKMLTGALEPTAGRVFIDGLDMAVAREAAQRRIGYLPENDPLYPEMRVLDSLDYVAALHQVPRRDRPRQIRTALAKTALLGRATAPINTLSRGYRQRLGVAQAIVHQPKVLILDEPTNGLDPTQVRQMRTLIRELASTATVIVSTHILHEVQAVCDRVIIIRHGRKVLDSRIDELRAGRRLLVTLAAEPSQASALFTAIPGVRAVEVLETAGPGHRYALTPDTPDALHELAARVAQDIAAACLPLYALQPESRDLETVFSELTAADEGMKQAA